MWICSFYRFFQIVLQRGWKNLYSQGHLYFYKASLVIPEQLKLRLSPCPLVAWNLSSSVSCWPRPTKGLKGASVCPLIDISLSSLSPLWLGHRVAKKVGPWDPDEGRGLQAAGGLLPARAGSGGHEEPAGVQQPHPQLHGRAAAAQGGTGAEEDRPAVSKGEARLYGDSGALDMYMWSMEYGAPRRRLPDEDFPGT